MKACATILAILLLTAPLMGQPPVDGSGEELIEWIGQYPSEDIRPSFGQRLWKLLSGKSPSQIVRPVSMLAYSPEDMIVLDQGTASVIQVKGTRNRRLSGERAVPEVMRSLVGICALPGGDILFTESAHEQVFRIDARSGKISMLNPGLKLAQPTGIAYSEVTDEIWVVETSEHRISVLDRNGEPLRQIGMRGTGQGEFNFPTSLCFDDLGNAYIVDAMNFRVQVFDKQGNFSSLFGQIGDATGYLSRPKGIGVDSQGNIYLVDMLFHTVQLFDPEGNYLYRFGDQGQGKAEFWMPSGIYIDRDDRIYVADSYNSRIQIFKLKEREP